MTHVDRVELYKKILIQVIQARFDNEQSLEEDHLCELDDLYQVATSEERIRFSLVSREISDQYLLHGGIPHTRPPSYTTREDHVQQPDSA